MPPEHVQKMHQASPAQKSVIENAKAFFSMYMDALRGKYKLHLATMGMITGGLIYFVMPFDAIPDFLPVIGFIDDLAVMMAINQSLQKELLAYRFWKKNASVDA